MSQLVTRPLDPKLDWTFFPPISFVESRDLSSIRPLSGESARCLWETYVSTKARERHPMLLPKEHWLGKGTFRGPYWSSENSGDAVVRFMSEHIPWPGDRDCFFFWMREHATLVPWAVFLTTWRSFLYEDEGPFLLSPVDPQVLFFGPDGGMGVCRRPL